MNMEISSVAADADVRDSIFRRSGIRRALHGVRFLPRAARAGFGPSLRAALVYDSGARLSESLLSLHPMRAAR